jgi:aminocarboxymuconate-semialdehyde decarboxylase
MTMEGSEKARLPTCPWCAIDAHAHWFPEEWISLLEREGTANGAFLTTDKHGLRMVDGPKLPFKQTFPRDMTELPIILQNMDKARIDLRILSLTNPMVYWAPDSFSMKLSQTYNDACAAACEAHPTKLRGAIMLPMQASQLAMEELERAARLPGMCCVYMALHVNGLNLDDRSFWPVYERLADLKLPLCLHPVAPCGKERMTKYHLSNLIGNPHESAIGAASLIFGGVVDAFPDLRIMLPHAGGSFPWLTGRWDNAIRRRPEFAYMKQPASAYLRSFHYDTISHSPQIMRYLIEMVGADRVVIGTDYNWDAGYEFPVDFVEQIPGLTESERRQIMSETAKALFEF